MTRKRGRKPSRYKSQMPTDPTEVARIKRLDAAAKDRSRLANPHPTYRLDHIDQAEAEIAKVADVISQGRKTPLVMDEINSHAAGGVDR